MWNWNTKPGDRPGLARIAAAAVVTGAVAAFATAGFEAGAQADADGDQPAGPFRAAADDGVDHRPYRVGEMVPDLPFSTLSGERSSIAAYAGGRPLVIAVRDSGCPLSKKYAPRLAALERDFAARGVRMLFINPSEVDTADDMRAEVERYGFSSPYAPDPDGRIAAALAANRTTDVFLLDPARTLVYRGAVDDQYGIGFNNAEPTRRYLRDAVEAVLDGRDVAVRATIAPGCVIDPAARVAEAGGEAAAPAVTYHNRISRIVQENCQSCHRSGGVAPFALETHREVKGRRSMIEYVVENGIMPPWHAAGGSHEFENDRSLSARDRAALLEWIRSGAPEGDPADAPLPRGWPDSSWQIGEPDLVLRIPQAYDVPAEGAVDYRYTYVKTGFAEDRWITRMEIRPTHPEVVHHVLVFLEAPPQEGESRRDVRRRWQGGLRGYFAGLVPGQGTTVYPEGLAKRLPAGAWLKFQIHYTPNGEAVRDRTEIGFVFADDPPEREMRTGSAFTTRFRIPPGEAKHPVVAYTEFDKPATIYSFCPHMHLRGRAFRYQLLYPDGREETVLDVPRYDFNWQTRYKLRDPVSVPAGTRLKATAWYDNSPENPANPDPDAWVGFGEQTWDEMMIGYFEYWHD